MSDLKKTTLSIAVALTLGWLATPVSAQSLRAAGEEADEVAALLDEIARPDQAIWEALEQKLFRLWSKSGSATADLMLQRGLDAMEAEDYATALDHLTALTDHAPDFAEAWHTRATVFFRMEEYGLAVEDIFRTLALNPHHYGALTGLGLIYEEFGDDDRALRALEEAARINPHRDTITDAIERLRRSTGRATL